MKSLVRTLDLVAAGQAPDRSACCHRVDPDNHASVRVAEKSGFIHVHDFTSGADEQPDGIPVECGATFTSACLMVILLTRGRLRPCGTGGRSPPG
jgi:hypothetical protein